METTTDKNKRIVQKYLLEVTMPNHEFVCFARNRVRPRGAAADQQPAGVLSEARAPRGQRVRRHPAEVRADAAADHERGEYPRPSRDLGQFGFNREI